MKFMPWALLLLAGLAASASSSDVAGKWKTAFVGGVAHMTIAQATFEFKVDGNNLAGTAHIGDYYPGTAPISGGAIDGDRISFTVIGERPSSNGLPTMRFVGSVHGDKIELTMSLSDGDLDTGKSEFKGERISEARRNPK
jgi:hypothetical protein